MFPHPSYSNATNLLNDFIKNGLANYSKNRNFDNGPFNRTNVSKLSPYIKRRIISEKEVILSCLKKFDKDFINKFIQEVFWRIYWKGWLEGRPKIWNNYKKELDKYNVSLTSENFYKDYKKAINGKTNIKCFDEWVVELTKYGYLHNHTRMWFASIWIFTLNLPWELGANFFYRNLIDADAASNTLSWRWVAGLHTPGKFYLARQDNIEKFSKFSFDNKSQLKKNISTPSFINEEYVKPIFYNSKNDKIKFYLINSNNLLYKLDLLKSLYKTKVIYLDFFKNKVDSEIKLKFEENAITSYLEWLKNNKINVFKVTDSSELSEIISGQSKDIHTFYPCVGYEKDKINEICLQHDLNIKYLFDPLDLECWSHAKSGFFKFKNNIDTFISKIQ
jgi:hypothetical protein